MSNPYLPCPVEVKEVLTENQAGDLKTFKLAFLNQEDEKRFAYVPGQFAQVHFPGVGESPIGIASSPTEKGGIFFTVKRYGAVTSRLHQAEPGARLGVRGPYGRPFPWDKMKGRDIQFMVGSYEEIRSRRRDFMYLDPPYQTAKAGEHYGRIDYGPFFRWLERQRARYVLSLNGFVGDEDCRIALPEWHYDEHVQIDVGKSPCPSHEDDEAAFVTDSIYVRRER